MICIIHKMPWLLKVIWIKKKIKERDKNREENIIKNIKNLFKLKNKNEAIKDRVIRDIKNLFEHEEEPVKVGNFWGNNLIEYESNSARSKTLPIKEFLIKLDHT